MQLSMTTDYAADRGNPQPYLARIAAAGFTHVHWCHHWSSDFLYGRAELAQIRRWLAELGLAVLDIHASAGQEKRWGSPEEYERLAGVELVANRLEMAAELGADVIVLHAGAGCAAREPSALAGRPRCRSPRAWACASRWRTCRAKALAASTSSSRAHGPDLLGLCYDTGHGNIGCDSTDDVARRGDRLIALHLNDNDGSGDQHRIPFTGTVDWGRVTRGDRGLELRQVREPGAEPQGSRLRVGGGVPRRVPKGRRAIDRNDRICPRAVPMKQLEMQPLLQAIRDQYLLSWNGTHGIGHWARVYTIGIELAAGTGADRGLLLLFARFSRRLPPQRRDRPRPRRARRRARSPLSGQVLRPRRRRVLSPVQGVRRPHRREVGRRRDGSCMLGRGPPRPPAGRHPHQPGPPVE